MAVGEKPANQVWFTYVMKYKTLCKCVHYKYLGRRMDPNGRIEQDVVTQLFEQHDTVL